MKISNQNVVIIMLFSAATNYICLCCFDPTDGFTNVPLTPYNFKFQKPYDVPLEQRYRYENGTHRMWVYADDNPHDPASSTQPRTEIRIQGVDYTCGVWQFEGHAFVGNGTCGATILQILGASHTATTIMLRIFDGEMRYYSGQVMATHLYDKWFRINLIHNVDAGNVSVFVDGAQVFETKDKGPGNFYFKCGVYAAATNISYYMESRWRDIKIYKK